MNLDIANNRRARLWWIFVAWSVNGLLFSSQLWLGMKESPTTPPWYRTLYWGFGYCYLYAAITPLILRLARKFTFEGKFLLRNISIHILVSLVVAYVIRVLSDIIRILLVWQRSEVNWKEVLTYAYFYFDYGLLMYWFIVLVNHTLQSYRKSREGELQTSRLQTQLAEAQLDALKTQLHPHFLFNTLNAISVLIQKSPESAQKMLTLLSDLLRITLDHTGVQEVPLKDELDFLERYIQIQQVRFGDRLEVKMEIDSNALNAKVPNLVLQPLVENAIEHGVAKRAGVGLVRVAAKRTDSRVRLEIQDNGAGVQVGNGKKEGVGLSNTRARLIQLYGEHQQFELTSLAGKGTIARIEIPFNPAS